MTATFIKFDTAFQAAKADAKLTKSSRFIIGHPGNFQVVKALPEGETAYMKIDPPLPEEYKTYEARKHAEEGKFLSRDYGEMGCKRPAEQCVMFLDEDKK